MQRICQVDWSIDALAGAPGELAVILRYMDPDSLTARGGVGF